MVRQTAIWLNAYLVQLRNQGQWQNKWMNHTEWMAYNMQQQAAYAAIIQYEWKNGEQSIKYFRNLMK